MLAGNESALLIAKASAEAAENSLQHAANDRVLGHAFWLLTQIPQVAKQPDFAHGLADLGLRTSASPGLLEVVMAFTAAVDEHAAKHGRTDFGEMVQIAASQTLSAVAGTELPSLLTPTSVDVQRAFAKFGSSKRFSDLTREFFSRLVSRSLNYFLSRELAKHAGPGRRFASSADVAQFKADLDLHCRQATRILKEFASGWYGNALKKRAPITPDQARGFAAIAFRKLRAELRAGRDAA
jgi:hypothetical protein